MKVAQSVFPIGCAGDGELTFEPVVGVRFAIAAVLVCFMCGTRSNMIVGLSWRSWLSANARHLPVRIPTPGCNASFVEI
jgi:hypothetical protein